MNTILIAVTVLFFVTQSAALKKIKIISLRQNLLSTAISSGMIAAALAVWAVAVRPAFSAETLLYGAIFGAVFVVTLAAYYFAMQSGPLSYTSFFFSASMLIPSVAGLLFWKEPFRWNVGIGIVLFLAAFYFITVLGGSKGGKVSRRWLVLCALTWACNGSLSIFMNLQQRSLKRANLPAEPSQMMLVSFGVAFALALAVCLFLGRKGEGLRADLPVMRRSLLPIVLVAAGTGGGNVLTSYLTGVVPSSYLFPVVQGSTMVLITLYSMLVLKEKINAAGKIGILIGACAIVFINL